MSTHPLKLIALLSISGLILSQLGLMYWLVSEYRVYIAVGLAVPLLIPLRGLFFNKRYTYRWVGFLTLLYLAIGISESFSNPGLRLYSILTLSFSSLLFVASVYYSRYLGQGTPD